MPRNIKITKHYKAIEVSKVFKWRALTIKKGDVIEHSSYYVTKGTMVLLISYFQFSSGHRSSVYNFLRLIQQKLVILSVEVRNRFLFLFL